MAKWTTCFEVPETGSIIEKGVKLWPREETGRGQWKMSGWLANISLAVSCYILLHDSNPLETWLLQKISPNVSCSESLLYRWQVHESEWDPHNHRNFLSKFPDVREEYSLWSMYISNYNFGSRVTIICNRINLQSYLLKLAGYQNFNTSVGQCDSWAVVVPHQL